MRRPRGYREDHGMRAYNAILSYDYRERSSDFASGQLFRGRARDKARSLPRTTIDNVERDCQSKKLLLLLFSMITRIYKAVTREELHSEK